MVKHLTQRELEWRFKEGFLEFRLLELGLYDAVIIQWLRIRCEYEFQ